MHIHVYMCHPVKDWCHFHCGHCYCDLISTVRLSPILYIKMGNLWMWQKFASTSPTEGLHLPRPLRDVCWFSLPHRALQRADVVLLLGARLNWILHFGRPPRFRPDVKIIQVWPYTCTHRHTHSHSLTHLHSLTHSLTLTHTYSHSHILIYRFIYC